MIFKHFTICTVHNVSCGINIKTRASFIIVKFINIVKFTIYLLFFNICEDLSQIHGFSKTDWIYIIRYISEISRDKTIFSQCIIMSVKIEYGIFIFYQRAFLFLNLFITLFVKKINLFNTILIVKYQGFLSIIFYYYFKFFVPTLIVFIIMDVSVFERNPIVFISKRLCLILELCVI